MTNEPVLAIFESSNIWLFAVDRRMTEAEFHEIGKARHIGEVTSWSGVLADWFCGTRKEPARRLAYHIQHASDPQIRLMSGVALQKLVAAPYRRHFRFESVDETTVRFRVVGQGILQEVTVTPSRVLTAVRDVILTVKEVRAASGGVLERGPAWGGVKGGASGAGRGPERTFGPTVEPIDLHACARYQDLRRNRAHAPIVELLGALADPATFWVIKAALEKQRRTEIAADLPAPWRQTPFGHVRRRAASDALHFKPTLEITELTPGVFQVAWHAEPQDPKHQCAHREIDVVLLVTSSHVHCIYAH